MLYLEYEKTTLQRSVTNRLAELEKSGEVVAEERAYFGALPVIRLVKPVRLDRIIKVAKR